MASGRQGRVMGAIGNALFAVHRNDEGEITHAAAAIVGQHWIKPDTWYEVDESGNFVEVSDAIHT